MPKEKAYFKQKYPTVRVLRENTDKRIPGLSLGATVTHSREYDYCRNRSRPGYYRVSKFVCKRALRNYKTIDVYSVTWHPKVTINWTSDDDDDDDDDLEC
jgi:hypothetical protein